MLNNFKIGFIVLGFIVFLSLFGSLFYYKTKYEEYKKEIENIKSENKVLMNKLKEVNNNCKITIEKLQKEAEDNIKKCEEMLEREKKLNDKILDIFNL